MEKEKFSLKDQLFNATKVDKIASELARVYPEFDQQDFTFRIVQQFPNLELKERIHCIKHELRGSLPDDFKQAVTIILHSLPEPCNPNLSDDDFGDFIYAPYGEFIASFGCSKEYLHFSLKALEEITTRFSMEYAIRPFLNEFPEETYAVVNTWIDHPHYHVRRLASEGTRPKLPWGMKISSAIHLAIPLLHALHQDKTRFVTRSVANHLNDISKIDSSLALDILNQWFKEGKQNAQELKFITKHALRTLIKRGDEHALRFIGFDSNLKVNVTIKSISSVVKMNEDFVFEIELAADQPSQVIVDYLIHFQNKRGEMNSVKVFKLKQFELRKDESIVLAKRHTMVQLRSTKTLCPGAHKFVLQVNGNQVLSHDFQLI